MEYIEPDPADPEGIDRPTDEQVYRAMTKGPYGTGRYCPPVADLFPPPPPHGKHPAIGEVWTEPVVTVEVAKPNRRWWQFWREW